MPRYLPLSLATRAQLFLHLATMEKAGLPAQKSFALLDLGGAARERQKTFQRLTARGVDPATAGQNSGLFTLFEARLLRAALAAGSPLPTYERLAAFYAAKAAQRKLMRSRMMLPVATLVLALLIDPLPELAAGRLSGLGYAWRAARPLLLLAALAATGQRLSAWFASGSAGPGRAQLEALILALPVFGRMHLRRNARDFVESLALLLQAGLPLFDALPVALATVGNGIVRADLASIAPAVTTGATLAQAVAALRVVDTRELFAFVHTGEQSGTLPEMLLRHATMETNAVNQFQLEMAAWLPRLFYACVAGWMALQLLSAPVIPPGMPQ